MNKGMIIFNTVVDVLILIILGLLLVIALEEADDDYPSHWIKEAIDVAVSQNKRNWSYISAILTRWQSEGKENGKSQGHSRKSRYI